MKQKPQSTKHQKQVKDLFIGERRGEKDGMCMQRKKQLLGDMELQLNKTQKHGKKIGSSG